MKEAEKIIDRSKEWFNDDQKNRAAVVILADEKENAVWGHSMGEPREIGHLIYSLMAKNKKLGYNIFVAACLYAHRHITAEERDKINAIISAVAEERKKIDAVISAVAFISAVAEARKKPKGGEK